MILHRRSLLLGAVAVPLTGVACSSPKTPLAHLHGPQWVHGAYEMYAKSYFNLQRDSEKRTHTAYDLLAQRGVTALEGLQQREVPFFIQVKEDGSFAVSREVPERLTFTADMSEADRAAAKEIWSKAREHIQTDYAEVRRLDWALGVLFTQLRRVRNAIENTRIEQFRLTRQILAIRGGKLPFELPPQVTAEDCEKVFLLLIERLEDDRKRLTETESSMVAVSLSSRATDSNSASLAPNLHKVLLAVVADAHDSRLREPVYPGSQDDHDKGVTRGRTLLAEIQKSPEYIAWEQAERDKEFQRIGVLLDVLDQLTGMDTGGIFRQMLQVLQGKADYLTYLRMVAALAPGAGRLSKALNFAAESTEKLRAVSKAVSSGNPEAMLAEASKVGLINVATRESRAKVGRQLIFLKDKKELEEVQSELAETSLIKNKLPDIPGVTTP